MPAIAMASAAPATAASPPSNKVAGLCYTQQSGSAGENRFLYFMVGASSGTLPAGTVWTFYVAVQWGNSSDYNAFTDPLVDSTPGENGGWAISHSLCASNATTFTRTYKVTVSNVSASSSVSCQPYVYTTTVKTTTQFAVRSADSGVTNQVIYNDGNFTWNCAPDRTTATSGCCNYGVSGKPDTSRECSTSVVGC